MDPSGVNTRRCEDHLGRRMALLAGPYVDHQRDHDGLLHQAAGPEELHKDRSVDLTDGLVAVLLLCSW